MIDTNVILTRQKQLAKVLNTSRIDALALNPGPSLTYLTGLHFHLSERPVLVLFLPGKIPAIILPELETGKLAGLEYKVRAFPYGEDPETWADVFAEAIRVTKLESARIGMEPRQLRLLEHRLMEKAATQAFFLDAQKELALLRMFKSQVEVAAMRSGSQVAEKALQMALKQFQVGMTEKELAAELTLQLLRNGSAPQLPFFPIVASGPNSANPHAVPSDRKIVPGDLLIIDWGANIDEYFSDITRTFAVGEVEPEFEKIHDAVHKANAAARKKAAPGVEAGAIDMAARSVIMHAGYSQFFIHRTGHGLGMEGHEEPYIRGDNTLPLQPGMAFTIEPGIYLPNRGGVRIEDDVVITETGLDCLTTLPRELIRLG